MSSMTTRITKRAIGTLALLWSLSLGAWAAAPKTPELNLMPYPQKVERLPEPWVLNPASPLKLSSPDQAYVEAALERFRVRFQRQTGTQLTFSGSGPNDQHLIIELAPITYLGTANSGIKNPAANTSSKTGSTKKDDTTQALNTPLELLTPEQEAYRLTIDTDRIHLQARTYHGVNHGLETLLQLLTTTADSDGKLQITLPRLTIEDYPRFRWRGLMLDSVRNFLSVDTIKRQLDGMAAAKLNIFHWHLTDDQGWRLESRHYPRLHEQASGGLYYTQDQIREIVAYAMERGIQVVPEIDMPGHTSAIGVAYPDLMSAPGPYVMEDRWGVHTPLLNPADEAVYIFADKVFAEVAELFPFAYVHIGGDEVNPRDWLENREIQAFMKRQKLATPEALHAYFNQRLAQILARHNRRMIGWDEIFHPGLPEGTVVQSWRGPDSVGEVANHGYPTLLSTGFYLDQPQPAAYHYRNTIFPVPTSVDDQPGADEHWETWAFELPRKRGNPVTGHFTLIQHPQQGQRGFIDFAGKSRQALQHLEVRRGITYFQVDTWMGPVLGRVERIQGELRGDMVVGNAAYPASGKLVAGSELRGTQIPEPMATPVIKPNQYHQVWGGEAALWAEMVDERHIDLRLWPRTFAVAERLWSSSELNNEDFMYRRLLALSPWSEQSLELQHQKQADVALRKLVPARQFEAARLLSQAVEPAQYYHRHHEKSVYGTYSRRDPLDRFADTLPVESHPVRQLTQQLALWRESRYDRTLAFEARATLRTWGDNAQQLLDRLAVEDDPGQFRVIAEQVRLTAEWGLVLMDVLENNTALPESVIHAARRQLRTAQSMHNEVVVAAAYPIERLLDDIPIRQEP